MDTYTPINKAILTSTIWGEKPHVRVLWLSMLISSDRYGRVAGSIPGLARVAAISLQECEDALGVLLAPDPYSRTKDNEGRRVAEIDGGWQILNHQKHKDLIDRGAQRNRERQAKHREAIALRNAKVTQNNDQNQNQNQKEDRDPPIAPHGAVQCELALETVPSEGEPRPAQSLPSETSRMRQNERNEGGELPEGTTTPKTLQRGSQTAKRAKEPKPPKPVETDPPDDFAPNEATLAAATGSGRDWRSDWVECRDWHLANGKRKVDWQATLRGWMRRNFGKSSDQPSIDHRPPPPTNDPWWHWETTRGAPHWREVEILKRNELERREREHPEKR